MDETGPLKLRYSERKMLEDYADDQRVVDVLHRLGRTRALLDAFESPPKVRKLPIGWWVGGIGGGWCPTKAVRDHAITKRTGP